MVRIRRSTVINAPLATVWGIIRDFNGHDRWHPSVATSELENGKRTDQVGSIRRFRLAGGELVREQLLALSDKHHSFRYTIVESDVPLTNYVADVTLKPVTDGNQTFWSWNSRFDTPPGEQEKLADIVAEGIYQTGFESVRKLVEPAAGASADRSTDPSVLATDQMQGNSVVVERFGGPEVFQISSTRVNPPGPGEVRIRQHAIGVNYIDVYCRTGYFNLLQPPGVPGMEAVGEVIDAGSGVHHLVPGQRVGYACPPVGAYTSVRCMNASLVVPLPDSIDDVTAAGALLKGMTAEFLLHRVHSVKAGETVLVFAPAGGVGNLLCQWANYLGATVIGATSSQRKAGEAKAAGAQHVILPDVVSLEDQVREITDGRGADVIYDAVGRDTFRHSVAALANGGHLVSYGQASGDIGDWNISSLASNSATVSRPNFAHYTDTPEKVGAITSRLFEAIEQGVLKIKVNHKFALEDAAQAHQVLENRQSTGSVVLIPEHTFLENNSSMNPKQESRGKP